MIEQFVRRQQPGPTSKLSPAQLVAGAFATLVLLGTTLLLLPASSEQAGDADFISALFTATSAVCLTGLTVVDTATYWTHLGQLIILGLIQIGGLGILTLATIASWVIAGQIGVKSRLNASAEGRGQQLGDVKVLLVATISFTAAVESVTSVLLTARFHWGYDLPWSAALWEGVFHAVSAFNNAGFGLRSNNLVPYQADPFILLPIAAAVIIGGLGFPVLLELSLRLRRRTQGIQFLPAVSLTCRFVLWGTAILLVAGTLLYAALEWNRSFAGQSTGTKLLSAFFQSVTTRTAGFNSVDFGQMGPLSLLTTDLLMFIGGGSGGTAGGVKITTIAVLIAVMMAELRGDKHTLLWGRRLPNRTMRQALAVLMISAVVTTLAVAVVVLLAPQFGAARITFEVISAFATVGLTTGITPQLPIAVQLILTLLMYAGRIGPVTLVAALAQREQRRLYTYPVERPLIG